MSGITVRNEAGVRSCVEMIKINNHLDPRDLIFNEKAHHWLRKLKKQKKQKRSLVNNIKSSHQSVLPKHLSVAHYLQIITNLFSYQFGEFTRTCLLFEHGDWARVLNSVHAAALLDFMVESQAVLRSRRNECKCEKAFFISADL